MAKTAKNQMKVKTGERTYRCAWAFKTPVETWSKATLLANIRAGLRYAIDRKIKLRVLSDEQNMNRNVIWLQFIAANMKGDEDTVAKTAEFCRIQGIVTQVRTQFLFEESDFAVELPEEPVIKLPGDENDGEEAETEAEAEDETEAEAETEAEDDNLVDAKPADPILSKQRLLQSHK